jgi:hypothetical protein
MVLVCRSHNTRAHPSREGESDSVLHSLIKRGFEIQFRM